MKSRLLLSATAVGLLIITVILNYYNNDSFTGQSDKVAHISTATESRKNPVREKNKIMKGLWVTYMELDMSGTDRSYISFKEKFDKIARDASQYGFNTLIVQVRPFSDALYKSDYFPASHILSGEQGRECNYDALKYMCEKSHRCNLDIHAWINPYRISTNDTPSSLSDSNPYVRDSAIGVKTEDGIYYNPALEKTRDLIVNGVMEIVENYDIDGIQFDDYFYPTKDKNFDSKEYAAYVKAQNNNCMSLSMWRKNNVNKLIKRVYREIHSIKDKVLFGISPQGNIKNNDEIYADVRTWCGKEGYIDYICPQLYYSLDNPALAYEDAIDDWNKIKKNKRLKIYSGLAGYKAGTNNDRGTWEDFDDILAQEYKIALSKKYDGIMLYSYNSILEKTAKKEIANLRRTLG